MEIALADSDLGHVPPGYPIRPRRYYRLTMYRLTY
jgi:hypothetical protein